MSSTGSINKYNNAQQSRQVICQAISQKPQSTQKVEAYFKLQAPHIAAQPTQYFEVTFQTLKDFGLDTLEDVGRICNGLYTEEKLKTVVNSIEKLIEKSSSLQEPNHLYKQVIIPAKETLKDILDNYQSPFSEVVDYTNCLSVSEEFQKKQDKLKETIEKTLKKLQKIKQATLRHNPEILKNILSSIPKALQEFSSSEKLTDWEIKKMVVEIRAYTRQFNIRRIWECNHGVGIETLHAFQNRLKLKHKDLFCLNDLCPLHKELEAIELPSEKNREGCDEELKTKIQFNNLPDEMILMIFILLNDMQAYNPSVLTCVSKRLKTISEDPAILTAFQKQLSQAMEIPEQTLEKALQKIIVPAGFLIDARIVKLGSFQNALIAEAYDSGEILFPQSLGMVLLQRMLKAITPKNEEKNYVFKTKILRTTLLKNIQYNNLLSAFLTLDSPEKILSLDFLKIIERLPSCKKGKIKQIIPELIENVLNEINRIYSPNKRSSTLVEIVKSLWSGGYIDEADAVINIALHLLPDITYDSLFLYDIVSVLLNTPNLDVPTIAKARKIANKIPSKARRSDALVCIAEQILLKTKMFDEAEKIARLVINQCKQSQTLLKIVNARLKNLPWVHLNPEAFDLLEAKRIAYSIKRDYQKSLALFNIVKILSRKNTNEAKTVAESIPDEKIFSKAMDKILQTPLQDSNFPEALKIARSVLNKYVCSTALQTIIKAILQKNNKENYIIALKTAHSIPNKYIWKETLKEVLETGLLENNAAEILAECKKIAQAFPKGERKRSTLNKIFTALNNLHY